MKLSIRNRCSDYKTYRASRVKSLFNVESGCNFSLDVDLPIEDKPWKIGIIVGPSGSGKTSIGRRIFGEEAYYAGADWPANKPIVEAVAPKRDFDEITGAFAAVGLGSVPAWLRPYSVLSNGEKFRAELARIILEAPERIVVDEFTSVIDRQIARIGALAFSKSWRRGKGQCVLLSCHYDILPWVQPDWVYDTGAGRFSGRYLQKRPAIELQVWQVDGSYWPHFEPHHYLKLPRMIAAEYYIGTVDGELVCHVATSPKFEIGGMRACRLVVMPEWQGDGVGTRFLDAVCQLQLEGGNRWSRKCPTYFHTSHPGLASALRRSKRWRQVSASLYGGNKARSSASIKKSHVRSGKPGIDLPSSGYGGHFRAVQGFKYVGEGKEK